MQPHPPRKNCRSRRMTNVKALRLSGLCASKIKYTVNTLEKMAVTQHVVLMFIREEKGEKVVSH